MGTHVKDGRLPQITSVPRDSAETSVTLRAEGDAAFRKAFLEAAENEKQLQNVRTEAAQAIAQLQEAQKILHEERASRQEQATQASAQIYRLQKELAVAAVVAPEPEAKPSPKAYLLLPLGAFLIGAAFVVFLILHAGWVGPLDPAIAGAVPHPGTQPLVQPKQAPLPEPDPASEMYALARLNGALDEVPIPALPSIMGAVNEWLWSVGLPPCSVENEHGEVSLVISSHAKGPLLLGALSRCAEGVEHFNQLSPMKKRIVK